MAGRLTHSPPEQRAPERREASSADRGALRPPQFTLATLLWIMAAAGALLAAMTAAGPIGGFALLLLALAILAHVAGNSIGSRLRAIGDEPLPGTKDEHRRPRRSVLDSEYAPASSLSRRTAISLTMIVFTITGAVVLGAGGGATLIWLTWGRLNIPTAVVAVVSSTVLGGLLGFTISSLTQIAGGAWWEANRRSKP